MQFLGKITGAFESVSWKEWGVGYESKNMVVSDGVFDCCPGGYRPGGGGTGCIGQTADDKQYKGIGYHLWGSFRGIFGRHAPPGEGAQRGDGFSEQRAEGI